MQTITLHIPSMHCSNCTNRIQNFLTEIEGVGEIEFDLDSKYAKIAFNPPADEEQIIEAIRDCGFEVF